MFQSLLAQTVRCAIDEHVVMINSASDPCVARLAEQN